VVAGGWSWAKAAGTKARTAVVERAIRRRMRAAV
jgi:hypothetical protein